MGKQNFNSLYNGACAAEGGRPSIKISALSDKYDSSANYAGVIIYAHDGAFRWTKAQSVKGYSGRFGYVVLKNTGNWQASDFKRAGEGMVHDKMYREIFPCSWNDGRSACGGFAVMQGQIKVSSVWLNKQSGCIGGVQWNSDGNKNMSAPETELINYAIKEWAQRGPGITLPISNELHATLSAGASAPSTPRISTPRPMSSRSRRLTTGDIVTITSTDSEHHGQHGVIEEDDNSGVPYRVQFGDGQRSWFRAANVTAHHGMDFVEIG